MKRLQALLVSGVTGILPAWSSDFGASHDVLWMGNKLLITQEKGGEKPVAIYSRDLKLLKLVPLENKKLAAYHLSPDDRLLAISELMPDGKYVTKVFDAETGEGVFATSPVENLRSVFWLQNCSLAVLNRDFSQTKMRNGLEVWEVPKNIQGARNMKCEPHAKDKKHKMPVAFFSDDRSYWGVNADGTRTNFDWIESGDVMGLQPGPYPYFYYTLNGNLKRARMDTKESVVIAKNVEEYFPSHQSHSLVVLEKGGALKSLRGNTPDSEKSDVKYDTKILRAQGAEEIWMGSQGRWVLVKDSAGKYQIQQMP